jgi:hypothetical protein
MKLKKATLFISLFLLSLLNSFSQTSYATEVVKGPANNPIFKITPAGHYEWYRSESSSIKLNTYDTSFYSANLGEYNVGPTADCASGNVCMYAVDLAGRRGIMRPLQKLSDLSVICASEDIYKGVSLLIETLSDSVSLDTLQIIQPSFPYVLSTTQSYQLLIKENNPIGLWCVGCSTNSNGPGTLLATIPTVTKDNIPNTKQFVKIPVNYLFKTAGKYWIELPYENNSLFVHLNCNLNMSSGTDLWVTPQFDDSTTPLAKALTSYNTNAQYGQYGAFFNMEFTNRKTCTPANGCSRIKVEGPNPAISTPIKKAIDNSIIVYPNPSSDRLFVRAESEVIKRIELTSMEGNLLLSVSDVTELPISTLQPGVYLVKVTTENTILIQKIIIE